MDLVTGAVGSLISKLGELLNEEYKLQKGVAEKIGSLSISFLDLAHNTLNSIGFLKGVLFFGLVVKFIPEPDFSPEAVEFLVISLKQMRTLRDTHCCLPSPEHTIA